MKGLFTILLISFVGTVLAQFHQPVFPNLKGAELAERLVSEYRPSSVLSSANAKDVLYSEIYKLNDSVRCVYSNHALHLPEGVDPSVHLFMNSSADGINLEHTYPRSKGADGTAGNDMHNLFPTRTPVNSDRGNLPFGEIIDTETRDWYFLNQKTSTIPTQNIDKYSERRSGVFEPQENHKGNVARAMMYLYTMYEEQALADDPLFFESQINTLCEWHKLDPVDSLEWERTFKIATHQSGKVNPFVLDSTLTERLYCNVSSVQSSLENISEFEIFPNPGGEALTVELVLNAATDLNLAVFDLSGRKIQQIIDGKLSAGQHAIPILFDYSGIVIFNLEIDGQVLRRKVIKH